MRVHTAYIIFIGWVLIMIGLGILISLLGEKACMLKNCKMHSKRIRFSMDEKLDPCDNFYKFVCDKYPENNKIYSNIISVGEELEKKSYGRLINFLSEKINEIKDQRTLKVCRTVYQGCSNLKEIDEQGDGPILTRIAYGGGFPLMEGSGWNHRNISFKIVDTELKSWMNGYGSAFFDTFVDQMSNGSLIPTFAISKRMQYAHNMTREQYIGYVQALYKYFKRTDKMPEVLEKELNDTATFRFMLLKIIKKPEDCPTGKNSFSSFTETQIYCYSDMLPNSINNHICNPDNFFGTQINFFGDLAALVYMKTLDVPQDFKRIAYKDGDEFKKYLNRVLQYLGVIPLPNKKYRTVQKRVVANYMMIENIIESTQFLPTEFRNIYNQFLAGTEQGKVAEKGRKNRNIFCAQLFRSFIPTTISALYMMEHPLIRQPLFVTEMSGKIKGRLKEMVASDDFMEEADRNMTMKRIDQIKVESPLPSDLMEELMNQRLFDKFHAYVCFHKSSVLGSVMNLRITKRYRNAFLLSRIEEATSKVHVSQIDAPKWNVFYGHVDIFETEMRYDERRSTVIIPLALLNYPIFYNNWPNYLNYGSFGALLSNAITEAVGYAGASYNSSLQWSYETRVKYEEKRACFIKQLNEYMKQKTDAVLTDMNCAQLAIKNMVGVQAAFIGYRQHMKDRFFKEVKLPEQGKYSSDQMFFINYATSFCTKKIKKYSKNMTQLEMSQISNEFAVLSSLKNFNAFSRIFKCKKGDKMFPSDQCKISKIDSK